MSDNLESLRNIEGFPIGKDEDLHALSNPPYYTAYPNPHIADFISKYGKPYDEATDDYHREPFVTDVSEGKNDPIYNAHTYHTKVPYKAIVPFIEHYTLPGEIVFDGFCGTGMTGVAAQMAGRRSILSDLSPAATFIAYNYNKFINEVDFQIIANRILDDVSAECGWMYETWHPSYDSPNRNKGKINYIVWSDVFECPFCSAEIIYLEQEVVITSTTVKAFKCDKCGAELSNRSAKAKESYFDSVVGQEINGIKQVPVFINYSYGGKKFEKKTDRSDLELIKKIDSLDIPYWYPTTKMSDTADRWAKDAYYLRGVYNVHHFYTKRNLWITAALWNRVKKSEASPEIRARLFFWLQSLMIGQTRMNRYFEASYSQVNRYLKGTLYIAPKISEVSPWYAFKGKIRRLGQASLRKSDTTDFRIGVSSFTSLTLPDSAIDYIFTDPPFGHNIQYSELNFIWEAWLGVFTASKPEAIISEGQKKSLDNYRDLMSGSFKEAYRVLKPGRWITVVFHNSKASVWNAIQDSLSKAGFIVAQVVTLDKQQLTMTQYAYPGAVQNDLVINAYKPRTGFTQRLISQAGRGLESDFVREHLRQLPIAVNSERSKEMLYSKYLAYYVQHGYQVAYNGEQFYRALAQWGLEERDGYWFVDESQAHEYEQRKVKTFGKKGITPQTVLFISDERSARQWVWNFLDEPNTYDEIYTKFMPALQTSEDEIPELKTLLEESFVMSSGEWKRPDQLTQAELEHKRQERLLRQFNEYLQTAQAGQKLKEVRREAVLAGFTECYRAGRFQDIITLGKKLDKRLLEESPELFDFVDIAEAKVE